MNKFGYLALGASIALAATGSISYAAGQDAANNGIYYGCITGVNSNITQVRTSPHVCKTPWTPIVINAGGVQGPTGPQGPAGSVGQQGPSGAPGYIKLTSSNGVDGGILVSTVAVSPLPGERGFGVTDRFYTAMVAGALWTVDPNTGQYYSQTSAEHRNFFYTTSDCTGIPYVFTVGVYYQGFLPPVGGTVIESHLGQQVFEVKQTKTLGVMASIMSMNWGCQTTEAFYQSHWSQEYWASYHASDYPVFELKAVVTPSTLGPLSTDQTR
jgi:hypothetical protein